MLSQRKGRYSIVTRNSTQIYSGQLGVQVQASVFRKGS